MHLLSKRALGAMVFFLIFCVAVSASEKPFQISIQAGPVAPADWMVQGDQWVKYDASSGLAYPTVRGFGNGADLVISGEYYSSDWGIALDTGVRLHIQRKVNVNTFDGRRIIENRLIIFPISFSLVHRISKPDSRILPLLGFGPDIYISRWETKDSRYYTYIFYRDWYKGDNVSFGAHFLAGLDFRIYRSFILKIQYRYTYVHSNWELENQDSADKSMIDDLNIGGTSLRFGVGYGF